jgi:integral membrane protein (TIGR00529 family)
MKESGHLDRIVENFGILARDDRTASLVMPALIGLLPMPGGALFSAPMVETALTRHSITGEEKTAVNYWFRHIWEYWWPLYPGVVLAVALLEVDTWRFMAVMAPMTLVTVLAGVIFLLRPLERTSYHKKQDLSWSGIRKFLWEIMPILIVVFVIIALAGLTGILELGGFHLRIPGAISVLPGLIASIIWVCAVNRISFTQFCSAAVDRNTLPMLFLIAAIMVFKGIMIDSGAVLQVRNELVAYKIPVMLIILVMPFLSGLITGIAIGFVGTAFPLIIPLFQSAHLFDYLSYAALAYTFGYMGMMLSPVHLCFLVTKDYFNASLLSSYRYLFLPALTVMITAMVIFLISGIF